jgi:DNA-binding response OmpR family regulator
MQVLDRSPAVRSVAEKSSQRQTGPKVLCIDDDPCVVNALARNLESRGAIVLGAYHGMQGFWLACTESPDVIITDIMMPRGNGDYVVECLRRNAKTRNIPVIVLSGICAAKLGERVKKLGADQVFAKPVNFNLLFRAIRALT